MKTDNIIIDSSVAIKWYFPEEEWSEYAEMIVKDIASGLINITVPILIFYEVNNFFKNAAISKRTTAEKAIGLYDAFSGLNFIVYSPRELFHATLSNAITFDISSYDASYIALAEYLQIPFYTADEKLVKKVHSDFVYHLREYQPRLS